MHHVHSDVAFELDLSATQLRCVACGRLGDFDSDDFDICPMCDQVVCHACLGAAGCASCDRGCELPREWESEAMRALDVLCGGL